MKPRLTMEALKMEYAAFGDGNRNHGDQRFGQYICNKYDFEIGNSYHIEKKRQAYDLIRAALMEYQA